MARGVKTAGNDKRSKKAVKMAAPWNPEWGFCKGLQRAHSFDQKATRFTALGENGKTAFSGEFKCINCTTIRRSVYVRGEPAVHTYAPPPGYKGQPADENGHTLPSRTIRDNYIRDHLTKRRTASEKG